MGSEEAAMAVIKIVRPSFRNPHDKIAFAVNSVFLASGYSLTATGTPAFSDTVLSSPPTDEVGIDGWNQLEDRYGFVYTKTDKGSKNNTVLVKCLVMGDHLVIDALSSKNPNNEPASLDINVNEYNGESESNNFADKFKNFAKLVENLKSKILSQVEDSPAKGSSSAPAASTRSETSEPPETSSNVRHVPHDPHPYHPGLEVPPVFPFGFDDTRPGPGAGMYPRGGPDIGGLEVPPVLPFGFDDTRPGPGAGMYPRGGPDIGGPMLIGPNDPRWGFRPNPEQPGGPLFPGAPPGARFDPYGPPGVPGFEPNRFGRNPRRPGNHPDLEPFGDPDFI